MPNVPAPLDDEILPSWISRTAEAAGSSHTSIYTRLGLDRGASPGAISGAHLSRAEITRIAAVTRLSESRVEVMLLSSLPCLPSRSLRAGRSVGSYSKRHLIRPRFSAACVTCLREDGAWRRSWSMPWVAGCARHLELLTTACGSCGRSFGRTRAAGAYRYCACGQDLRRLQPAAQLSSAQQHQLTGVLAAIRTPSEASPFEALVVLARWMLRAAEVDPVWALQVLGPVLARRAGEGDLRTRMRLLTTEPSAVASFLDRFPGIVGQDRVERMEAFLALAPKLDNDTRHHLLTGVSDGTRSAALGAVPPSGSRRRSA